MEYLEANFEEKKLHAIVEEVFQLNCWMKISFGAFWIDFC